MNKYSAHRITALLFLSVGLMIPGSAQSVKVSFAVKDINASGGLTVDKKGNIYVSDFGETFTDPSLTKIYKIDPDNWEVSVFAEGFNGASGSYISPEGLFYQSNPKSGTISIMNMEGQLVRTIASELIKTPVGLVYDPSGYLFIANCGNNNILKADSNGVVSIYSESGLFRCPNGMTRLPNADLAVVNFNSDKILRITPDGKASVLAEGFPVLTGGPNPVGLGHIVYSNGYLYATSIGRGYVYRIMPDTGEFMVIAGNGDFKNTAGPAPESSFSKPNGIAVSVTGDSLYINVSDPSWLSNPAGLHPAHLMLITGICSLPESGCR